MIHTVVVQLLNSTTTVSCILSYENRYFRTKILLRRSRLTVLFPFYPYEGEGIDTKVRVHGKGRNSVPERDQLY